MMCLNGLQWGLSSSCLPSSIDGMVVDLCGPYTVCFLCPPEKKHRCSCYGFFIEILEYANCSELNAMCVQKKKLDQ